MRNTYNNLAKKLQGKRERCEDNNKMDLKKEVEERGLDSCDSG
jgi:hypothetical protein